MQVPKYYSGEVSHQCTGRQPEFERESSPVDGVIGEAGRERGYWGEILASRLNAGNSDCGRIHI